MCDEATIDDEIQYWLHEQLEERVEKLEAENAEYRKMLGLPPKEVPVEQPRQRTGMVYLDLVNGVMTIDTDRGNGIMTIRS